MLKLAPAFLALLLVASSPARAQVMLDVSKITCWQFATYKVASAEHIAIWLNGYFHGTRGDLMVDTQDLDRQTSEIQQYCIKHGDMPLMQAVDTLLGARN
jgi:acid stress chaperone HdeB